MELKDGSTRCDRGSVEFISATSLHRSHSLPCIGSVSPNDGGVAHMNTQRGLRIREDIVVKVFTSRRH